MPSTEQLVVPRDVWWVTGDRPRLQIDRWSDDRFVDSTSFVIDTRRGAANDRDIAVAEVAWGRDYLLTWVWRHARTLLGRRPERETSGAQSVRVTTIGSVPT